MHRTLTAALLCLCLLAGHIAAEQPAASHAGADLHSFVNWDFRHRKKLRGWRATETAILKTLEQSRLGRTAHTLVENGSSGALREFLRTLPARTDSGLSIVYLASHQSPAGEWDFVQKGLEPLGAIAGASRAPAHPGRIVIVDACYAAALREDPAWNRALQSPTLFAASASEEAQELDFSSPQPLDLRRRYPAAAAWLDAHMGRAWDGRLSFLGFVWVQTFVTSKAAPADAKGWISFLRKCEQTAAEFRRDADPRLASRVTLALPTSPRDQRKN